jgi:hypothetical protein
LKNFTSGIDLNIELNPKITYWSAVSLEATGFVKIPM